MRNSLSGFLILNIYKGGEIMVELDQFRYELNGYEEPLKDLRDSL